MNDATQYNATNLSVLEGLDAVRKRPGMYIGTTGTLGLMHCLWEIIDNSVDEALAGFCTAITVTLYPDGSIEVADNGRGIPVDIEPKTKLSGVELVLTRLHAGAKFGTNTYHSTGGLHGVGLSVVNALSSRLHVEVDRNGNTYSMDFHNGQPGTYTDATDLTPTAHFKKTRKGQPTALHVVPLPANHRDQTGTRIHYWLDHDIFDRHAHFDTELLLKHVQQTAFLVKNLTITLRDLRDNTPQETCFHYDGGTQDFVRHLAQTDTPLTDIWHIEDTGTYSEEEQILDPTTNTLITQEVECSCTVDVSLCWVKGYTSKIRSFVNAIETPNGGTHVDGFLSSLTKQIRKTLNDHKKLFKNAFKNSDQKIERTDITSGLIAVISLYMQEPQFQGQTKDALGTPQIRHVMANLTDHTMSSILNTDKKKDLDHLMPLLEKIVNEMQARLKAHQAKEITRRKNIIETSAMPAKLSDCLPGNDDISELFIVEGDSALGTAKAARNSTFQALLPIRGKILNVRKASQTQILNNAECSAIIQVIGGGAGTDFDLSKTRYNKIIMMTDADVDGAHIRILLLTLFYRYMKPLIEEGHVYAAVPPLHRIALAGSHKGEVLYTYSEEELGDKLSSLDQQKITYNPDIQRYKGLGEMDASQLAETTMDPRTRLLRRIRLTDAERAEEIFELLMGNKVPPRKQYIIDNADAFDRAKIDY